MRDPSVFVPGSLLLLRLPVWISDRRLRAGGLTLVLRATETHAELLTSRGGVCRFDVSLSSRFWTLVQA